MKSIFVFNKSGDFVEEIKQEKDLASKIIAGLGKRQLFVTKEKEEKTKNGIRRIIYKEPQSPNDAGYFGAVVEELENQGYTPYVFDGEKREVARLLLVLPLANKERLEFFDNLVAAPNSKVSELKRGIEEDLRKI